MTVFFFLMKPNSRTAVLGTSLNSISCIFLNTTPTLSDWNKHYSQKQLRVASGFFWFTLPGNILSSREIRARTQGRNRCRWKERMMLSKDLLSLAHAQSGFLKNPGSPPWAWHHQLWAGPCQRNQQSSQSPGDTTIKLWKTEVRSHLLLSKLSLPRFALCQYE